MSSRLHLQPVLGGVALMLADHLPAGRKTMQNGSRAAACLTSIFLLSGLVSDLWRHLVVTFVCYCGKACCRCFVLSSHIEIKFQEVCWMKAFYFLPFHGSEMFGRLPSR
jgi:hypothetical protein